MPVDLARNSRALPTEPGADAELARRAAALRDGDVGAALRRYLEETDARTVEEQVRLARTPAPPFQEEERGRLFAELLEGSGGGPATRDEAGNILSWRGDPGPRPLVLSAHLDTVFPAGQEIRIERRNDLWTGPGICDDARGLAVLLAVVRALEIVDVELPFPLLLVGTVGEEGTGDLRGVRHLLGQGGRGRDARGFISLDGAGLHRIVASGVGSRRYRVGIHGPGGHSWVNAGRINPIRVLARAVEALDRARIPPGATVNVGRIHGGTSVNAIPTEVWAELEARSEDAGDLERTARILTRSVEEAVEEANRHGLATSRGNGDPGLARLEVETIGERPAGRCDPESALARAAVAATRAVAGRAELAASSTDANYGMSLGIPSLTLGAGGEAGEAHTPREWYRNTDGPEGPLRAALALLMLGEAEGG